MITLSKQYFRASWDQIGQLGAVVLAFMIPVSTSLTSLWTGILLLAWFSPDNKRLKRAIFWHHPLSASMLALGALTILGGCYSIGDPKSIWHACVDVLRLGLIPLLLYYYQDPRIARYALGAFIGAMGLTLVLGFLKVHADFPIGLKYTVGAVFKSHIKTSFFMAMAVFFLALQAVQHPRFRLAYGVLIGAMIYYLFFLSIGRVGVIALGICLGVFAWYHFKVKGLLIAGALGLITLIGAYFSSDLFYNRINLLSQDLDIYLQGGNLAASSLGSRLSFMQDSLSLYFQHPWVGSGTGSFAVAYANNLQDQASLLTDNPHNQYLLTAVELGAVGLGGLLLMFSQQWRLARVLSAEQRCLCHGVLLTFFVGCFLNSWLKDFTEAYFYCFMVALCFARFPFVVKEINKKAH